MKGAGILTSPCSASVGRSRGVLHAHATRRPALQRRNVRVAAGDNNASRQTAAQQAVAWLSSKGAAVDKISVSSRMEDGQLVLVAAKDIAAGESILSVPETAWLSAEAVSKSPIGSAVEGLEAWLQVALLLLHSRATSSSAGEWGPYLASLPTHPATPLFWTESQLAMLEGTQLLESLQGYRAFFQSKFQELFGPQGRLTKQQALFPAAQCRFEDFLAAATTVRARAHPPLDGDRICLVPIADMASHLRQPNTVWRAKSAGLFVRGRALVVEATCAVRKGEQLSLDYAPELLDSSVLLDCGVVDTSTPRPGYQLSLSLSESDRFLDDKLDVLQGAGFPASQQFTLTPTTLPSQEMMGFLRLMQLQGGDAFLLEAIFRPDLWGFVCDPVSEDNERNVCTSMAEGARASLALYPSSLDEDLALLGSGRLQPGSPEEAAVRVRLGEQEALEVACQWFEERGQSLKRMAFYQERRLRRLGLIDDEGRTTYDSFFADGIA